MRNWMSELAAKYERTRSQYPDDKLIILFDIDGTILDMRYMIQHVLQAYDREHKTSFFRSLDISRIHVHENNIEPLLIQLNIPVDRIKEIIAWYTNYRWTSEAILQSHRPYVGVLEVIKWFQLQPKTYVGINTGRPEAIRKDTLNSLNKLGETFRVKFDDELLFMNPRGWNNHVQEAKVAGVRYFQEKGYRIFAVVDNEPENLNAISKIDPNQEILLLHANTIFESKRTRLPARTVKGRSYDITELIPEQALPQNVQFVWHGVNDEANLRQFLASEIIWGECDVRLDPTGSEPILRHDSFNETPLKQDEEWFYLDYLLKKFNEANRSVKLDLKSGGILIDLVLELVKKHRYEDSRLWFNGNVERLQEQGFRQIRAAHPEAVVQCPVDFLAPLICSAPQKAKEILDMFRSWGVNRFSISWFTDDLPQVLNQMDEWNFEINIYNLPDLESFLQAVLLLPRSITSDFNFPKWHYFGRGAGKSGEHYEYSISKRSLRKQFQHEASRSRSKERNGPIR